MFHRSVSSLVLSKILITVRFELGKNRERHIKIGKFDRFFGDKKVFFKNWEERCHGGAIFLVEGI